jgi:diacylglycerol kinase
MTLRLVRPEPAPPAPRRRWRDKFREAFRGVKLGVRGQSSFFVHFFCATLVIAAAAVLQCDLVEWCVLLGCVGAVLTAESFNSAIETLFAGLEPAARDRHYAALEIAAGAVLTASVTAAVIGVVVLGRRVVQFLAPAVG